MCIRDSLEPDEEHYYTEQTLISLGEEVQHLLTSGVRLNDIAILVRKNKSILSCTGLKFGIVIQTSCIKPSNMQIFS